MITLVLGGNKSGKSTYAEKLALDSKRKVYYIATSVFKDDEMAQKIKMHQERRPKEWETIEEGYDLLKIIQNVEKDSYYLIDCMTVYLSNILTKYNNENNDFFVNHIKDIISLMKPSSANFIIVSNEVGCGIISLTAIGRRFAEVSGIVNQILAEASEKVYLLTAGIPLKIKS
jgi:adenosylcobinamide kinase / adenosylcobinamide-phosphate guanylyltransferase